MKSRYDRNQELYEKVKNNDYEDYNNSVVDDVLEFDRKESREEFREKKRLSVYFQDIDSELETANSKLNDISEDSGLEIKKNVDLKSLIEQAKKNQRDQGGTMFSNTQYEILNSLNVEEQDVELDEEDKDLILEDIIGKTMEMTSVNDIAVEEEFDNTIVDLNSLEDFEDAFATKNIIDDYEDTDMLDLEEIEDDTRIESSVFAEEEVEENIVEEAEQNIVEEAIELVEEKVEEPKKDKKKEKKEKKQNKREKNIEEDDEEEEEGGLLLTLILVVLIIALIAVGGLIIFQYI